MPYTTYPLIEHKRLFLIENRQGLLVIDTGSPVSFHEDGVIELGEYKIDVRNNIQGIVDSLYLKNNLGIDVKGLLGMDFMGRHSTIFNAKRFGGFIGLDDDALYGTDAIESFSAYGLPGIVMEVNGKSARMLADSGASLSYIDRKFVMDAPFVGRQTDFSVIVGDGVFETDTYKVPCHIGCGNDKDKDLRVVFGLPPAKLESTLRQIGVDGLIGYDLFSNFRISLQNGLIALPPQGI